MIVTVLLAFLVCTNAAPHWGHDEDSDHGLLRDFFGEDDLFDTEKFWSDLNAQYMTQLEVLLTQLQSHFPFTASEAKVEGNEYVITVGMANMDEKNIVVKARKGVVMIQALRDIEGQGQQHYTEVRTLPDNVDPSGSWSYNNETLRVTFTINKTTDDDTELITTTSGPTEGVSREEMEPHDNNTVQNAEIEENTKVQDNNDKDAEILTNEIPTFKPLETSTVYPVDLNDVERFRPIRYR